eukprot:jgi/Bigna1/87485/estExt_fgenesh1_pg.C_210006
MSDNSDREDDEYGEEEEDHEGQNMDEDDQDDDDDDGHRRENTSNPRPSKRPRIQDFVDDEAEVSGSEGEHREDEDDQDDRDDYDYGDGFVADDDGEVVDDIGPQFDEKRYKEDEENVKRLQEKHAKIRMKESRAAEDKRLPAVNDPKLFMVPVKIGKEREILIKLLKTFQVRQRMSSHKRLRILSAFTTPATKGFIHVEAWKADHVVHAFEKFAGNMVYAWKTALVPIENMVPSISITEKVKHLRRLQWVRLKQGIYKGDLAQVEVPDEQGYVVVKLIPRIDYTAIGSGQRRRRAGVRPMPQLFNRTEIQEIDPDNIAPSSSSHWHCRWEAINPTLEEVQRFTSKTSRDEFENDGTAGANQVSGFAFNSKKVEFRKGDRVKVVEGELSNLTGRVTTVTGDTIFVLPERADLGLTETLDFTANELIKFFRNGDHVMITAGVRKDETGHVVDVNEEEKTVTIIHDTSRNTTKVFSSDVTMCNRISAGKETLGNYRLYDLVMLGQGNYVVIVKVENTSFRVLDVNGNIQTARLQDVGRKRRNIYATAYDNRQNQITQGDVVSVISGEHKGLKGEIKHVQKSYIYLYNRQINKNSGIFVVPAKQTVLSGYGGVTGAAGGGGGGGAFGDGGAFGGGGGRCSREVVPHSARGHSENSCGKHQFVQRQDVTQAGSDADAFGARGGGGFGGGYDDMRGGQTPMIGSQTPSGLDEGGRTPAYAGSMTPAYDGGGGATPGGSFVPATPFNPNAGTPFHDDEEEGGGVLGGTGGGGSGHGGSATGGGEMWSAAHTPVGGGIETPHTPLTSNPMTSAATPHTPQTAYTNPHSPYPGGGMEADDSGGPGGPGASVSVNTPRAVPTTPATPSTPHGVSTPYGVGNQQGDDENDDGDEHTEALTRDEDRKVLLVLLQGTAVNLNNQQWVVVRDNSRDGGKVTVRSVGEDGKDDKEVARDAIVVTPAQKDDRAIILRGDHRGAIGKLMSVQDKDRIIMTENEGMQIVRGDHVGKYIPL